MSKRRELLIILILALQATVLSGRFLGFPFRILKPVFCIELLEGPFWKECYPFRILWTNAFLDLAFWFMVLTAGWWGIQKLRRKGQDLRKSSSLIFLSFSLWLV